jgi:hypothetical protein
MMAERRREMERKKFAVVLGVLAVGLMLSASAWAQGGAVTGYLMGDPSPGKLVPYWAVGGDLATIIGLENTSGQEGPDGPPSTDLGFAGDILIHVTAFSNRSTHLVDDAICLSPFDFGFVILQEPRITEAQEADIQFEEDKGIIFSREAGDLGTSTFGYVSLKVAGKFGSTNGSCSGSDTPTTYSGGESEPLAAWTILQDVGDGFFGTEIPTPTALVNDVTGAVRGGLGAFGLIPGPTQITADTGGVGCSDSGDGNRVFARYDVNPSNGSETSIVVWQRRNQFNVSGDPGAGCNRLGTQIAFLDCETEQEVSTSLSLPDEVNLINPANLNGISQCTNDGLFRGVLRFTMPDTGFLWSHLSQEDANFRMNFLGINMDCNWFISAFIDPINFPPNTDPLDLPLDAAAIEENRSCNFGIRPAL